jgi:hypothetical protein
MGNITASSARFSNIVTAQTLVVQVVSSSTEYASGSNIFGNNISNTHQFTGSMYVTGALYVTTGSIGIGTISPKSYSTLTNNGQLINLNNIGIDVGQSFRLNNYYNSGTVTDRTISTGYAASIGLDNANGGLIFNMSSITSSADNNITTTERMRITSGGNVGIGVSSITSISGYTITQIEGTTSGLLAFSSAGTVQGRLYGGSTLLAIEAIGARDIVNYTNSTERMRITSAGNVGIGTTSPNYALVISSSASGGNRVQITPTTTYAFFQIDNSAGTTYIGTDNSTAGVFGNGAYAMSIYNSYAGNINFYTSATIRMTISSGSGLINIPQGPIYINKATSIGSGYGLVIGSDNNNFQTMAMFVKADGNNNINFFNAAGTYVSSISTSTTTVTYGTTSDYRLKKDLKDFNGLDLVNNIKSYDFAWKINNVRSYGVLAHELQPIIPDAVNGDKDAINEDETIKNQNVDYSKIVPVLIKALQELNQKFEDYKSTHP